MTDAQRTERLRHLKKNERLTAADISELLRVERVTVWRWISGDDVVISAARLMELEAAIALRQRGHS